MRKKEALKIKLALLMQSLDTSLLLWSMCCKIFEAFKIKLSIKKKLVPYIVLPIYRDINARTDKISNQKTYSDHKYLFLYKRTCKVPTGFRDQLASRRALCIMMGYKPRVSFVRSGIACCTLLTYGSGHTSSYISPISRCLSYFRYKSAKDLADTIMCFGLFTICNLAGSLSLLNYR